MRTLKTMRENINSDINLNIDKHTLITMLRYGTYMRCINEIQYNVQKWTQTDFKALLMEE